MLKLGVHSITELIHYALNHELVSLPQPNVKVAASLGTKQQANEASD